MTHRPAISDPGPAKDYDSLPTRSSLLGRLRDVGDDASWRVFFETYWRLIYNVARKSGLEDEDAQDVVQDTVIAVARRMPEFVYDPARGSFKQWLLLITRRRIQDRLRQIYRSLRTLNPAETQESLIYENVASPTPAPDTLIDAAWENAWRDNIFQMALARVRERANPKFFQVFDYCVLQELPPSRVARMLGLSVARVYLAKHRISAAVKRAARAVEEELGGART
jgi:RNA polymerase sigma factor (sigma-70 family)